MIVRGAELLIDGHVSKELLRGCIDEFMRERLPKMNKARKYYDGNVEAASRVRAKGLPNTKARTIPI